MSETVYYKGKLKEVKRFDGESIEEQCKRLLHGETLHSYMDSYQEMLQDEYYQQYVVYDDILYSVEKESLDPDEEIFNAIENEDGSINFEIKYYNGGFSFNKAIEVALNNRKII